MHANKREEIEEVRAGDIAAAIGLKDTRTGDTLCDDDHPIILEAMKFPDAGHRRRDRAEDEGRPGQAGDRAAEAGRGRSDVPRAHRSGDRRRRSSPGMGELHLEIIVDRMMREFKVDANVGRPQVAYRETIRKRVEKVEGKFIRQSGGKGQYGHVVINMEPAEPGTGFVFEDKIVGGVDPARVHRPGGAGDQGSAGERHPRRLSDGRREGRAGLRLVPRRRLERNGVQDRRARWRSRRRRKRAHPVHPRADDERRGASAPKRTWATCSATCRRVAARSAA